MNRVFIVISLFVSVVAGAQDSNYWLSQVGNTSSLLGGASINGTFDNSGIFYNPGSLAFVENTGISISGNAFYFNVYRIINGAGKGLDLKTTGLTGAPSLVSGVVKNKKNPDFSITYAIINKELNSTLFTVENNMFHDVISDRPGDEYYSGIYKYQNRYREDWVGIGMGQKFFDSKFGIGISQFVTMRTLDFLDNKSAQVFADLPDPTNFDAPLASHTFYDDFVFRNIGLVWKLGINYQYEKFRIGFVLTTPKANIPVLNGKLIRSEYIDIPSESMIGYRATFREKIKTIHHTPWMFDFGVSFIREKHMVYVRMMAATAVKPYNMFKSGTGNTKFLNLPPGDDPFKTMQDAKRPVVNVSAGYFLTVRENLAFLAGLRTDFNNYNEKKLPRKSNFVPSIGYLNLYHASAGTVWYEKRYRMTIGFTYSMGFSHGDLQQINLTSPSDESYLFGIPDHSTVTRFNQIGFHFGFTYLFSLIER